MADLLAHDGRQRVLIEDVTPQIDAGRFPIKRVEGERVTVTASAFSDAHDVVDCALEFRADPEQPWSAVFMRPLGQDRWQASFDVPHLGRWSYRVTAWADAFQSWRRDLKKRVDAGSVARVDLTIGADLVRAASQRASEADAERLREVDAALRGDGEPLRTAVTALDDDLRELMQRYSDRSLARSYPADGALEVVVDRVRARYGAWYELFPRSCGASDHVHGTFADVIARLPYVAQMGFDVLYLPPIHPIGRVHRKGKNNAEEAEPGDVGSPWAIGASEGGHKAIHPQLGTLEDFQRLLSEAKKHHLELAMDVAFQCAPDHPYVAEHPEWFKVRPDGSIQYAENPPKKYQDIFPFDFETPRWRELWEELRSVVQYWVDQGVRIFRVDNPHTKPFAFWEWLIAEIRRDHPETIFLAEAFARPRVMQALAKLGFTQSYTYFTWRNTKQELTQYFTALTESEQREYFRPSAWPNTPDILPEFLQIGGREAFRLRVVLAATLSANYGIYGPSFELGDNRPRTPGGEEYLDSEKYQLRHWTLDEPMSLAPFIGRLNRIRRDNAALQTNVGLTFHNTDNEYLLCYSKRSDDGENTVLVVVNLDPHHTHSGWIDVSPTTFGLPQERTSQLHDLLTEARYFWQGERLFVELNPQLTPAHLFRMRRWVRTEHDFDYFM